MNWLDIVIIVFLAITTLIGYRRGLAKIFFPLAVILLGIFVAGHFYGSVADSLNSWFESRSQAKIAAFVIIFILFIAAMLVLFSLLRRLLDILLRGKVEMSKTAIPFAGIIVGIALAGLFYDAVASRLSSLFESHSQAAIAAFLIIFILAMAVTIELLVILSSVVSKPPYTQRLAWVDRLGGIVLGWAIGGVITGTLLTIITKFYFSSIGSTVKDSSLAVFFVNNFPFVLHLLPKEFNVVRQFFS